MICEQIATEPVVTYKAIGIAILVVVLEILLIEIIATWKKNHRISQFFQHFSRKYRMFGIFVFSVFIWLAWHLTFGGPL